MKKIKTYLCLTAVILLTAFLTYSVMSFKSYHDTKLNSTAVLERIRNISELNTVEMYFNEVVDFKDAKKFREWTIPLTTKSFLFTATAKVKAGVDLSGLTEEKIKISKKKITIQLPQPVITSKEILDTKSYDEKDGLFNEITNEDTLNTLNAFQDQLEKQATDSGILDKARENAKNTLESWLELMNFKEIEIQFE